MAGSEMVTVRRFYDLFAAGNVAEAVALLHEDFVLREPPGLPYSGDHHGVRGFLELMGRIGAELGPELEQVDFLGSGTPVVVRIRCRFTSQATGRSVAADIVELYHVADERITEVEVLYRDPAAVASLFAD